jgi:hypothetical protein
VRPLVPPRGPDAPAERSRVPRLLIKALAAYSAAVVTLITFVILVGSNDSTQRAVILMALGLVLIWIVLGGLLQLRYRDAVRARLLAWNRPWQLKFVLFATGLLLLEEVVTTSMTNLAPYLGSQRGVAYITASDNYLLVIAFHSVSVLFPAYIGWAWVLKRYDFTPNEVFLLYGLLGTTAEATLNPSSLFGGFWFFVYGLMIYLPAYSLPKERPVVKPRAKHYVLAILVPYACQLPAVFAVFLLKGWLGIHLFTG